MLLKIEGVVPLDYYEEQERDKDNNVGLGNIANRTIKDRTFRCLPNTSGTESFRERVDELLASGRPVGIYTETSPSKFHGYVIAGKDQGKYVLLSKHSEEGAGQGRITETVLLSKQELDALKDRDCIYLEAPTLPTAPNSTAGP